MCDWNRCLLIFSFSTFFLITARHQDRIVHSCSKLNSTNDNTCHKRKARSLVIWNCHIDKDCELNNRHKDDRKGDRLKHDHNNDKDCKDWNGIDCFQIDIGRILKVLHQRSLSDDHCMFGIRFYNFVNCWNLFVDLICCRFIFRTNKCQFIIVTLKHLLHIIRDHGFRNGRSEQCVHSKAPFDSIDFVNLFQHLSFILCIHILLHQDHVHIAHLEVVYQFLVCHVCRKCIREWLCNIVVNFRMIISVNCREQQHCKQNEPQTVVFCNKRRWLINTFNQWSMFCLFNRSIEDQYQRW